MKIAFFGSSLLSAYWNGAATYYRGIIRALHALDCHTTFYEPDAFGRQQHRDIEPPSWASSYVYVADEAGVWGALEHARHADMIVKASGVGVFDELLEAAVFDVRRSGSLVGFWDVDAPATLDRIHRDPADPFRALIPRYDFIFTYGGGDPVTRAFQELGARLCAPIYNALDPDSHYPVPADNRFAGDLGFLGNRLPDREERVDEFFFCAAKRAPQKTFVLGGSGWADKEKPASVRYVRHVFTADHNAFNCTPKMVLNISRESMARYGFSPATRVFEAAAAAACLITDFWEGIELFLEPWTEVLIAHSGEEVSDLLQRVEEKKARSIGAAALRRVLAEHTYVHRAERVEALLAGRAQKASY